MRNSNPPLERLSHLPQHSFLILSLMLLFVAAKNDGAWSQEKSVNPGVNKQFADPDVSSFVERFEKEGREIYEKRDAIADAVGLKEGMSVGDIGAGTGLFSRIFAQRVGAKGRVFAVDISDKFIRHIEETSRASKLGNIAGVVCKPNDCGLPTESIDVAFICDTFHHFEFPLDTMRSIRRALRPGGRLVMIDFHRIPGVSSDWSMSHVRDGQEAFTRDILFAGFRQVGERDLLKDNYLLEFVATDVGTPKISEGKKLDDGVVAYDVESPFQSAPTKIRVVTPDQIGSNEKLPVVYVLPVEAGDGTKYGDGLAEAKRLNLANKLRAIFVAPTFSKLPWYADHPSDIQVQQESHLLHVVIPFVEKTYPVVAGPDGRNLVGFSKSGWGASSLLIRHPGYFGRAAAFDSPMMLSQHTQFGSEPIFGTKENFSRYQIGELIARRARLLGESKRLALIGDGNFASQHHEFSAILAKEKVAHENSSGKVREHLWSSGWLEEAATFVVPKPPQPKP